MKKFSFSCPVRASVLLFEFFLRHQVGGILSRACVLAYEMVLILQIGDFNSQSYVIALHETSYWKLKVVKMNSMNKALAHDVQQYNKVQ